MGASSVFDDASGSSPEEAYRKLSEDTREEHGSDFYNGQINDLNLVGEFHGNSEEFETFIDMKCNKGDVYYMTRNKAVPNTNKIKTVVHRKPAKGTRKWITEYAVTCRSRHLGASEKQDEAIEYARRNAEETKEPCIVNIRKRLVSHSPNVAIIEYKRSSKECYGSYLFGALAPD
tara:strand:+ start:13550 stop:14074 length:525 start_codon:yes stop_codon:yes gene_type:complete